MSGSVKARAFGLRAGERIGRYECIAPLAMGGMAEVYLARHRGVAGFEKRVVIKRVLPHLAIDTDFVDMFLKEARLAAALDHPGIAQVIDFGHDGSDYFMVLEYVQGHDLRAVLKAAVATEDALPLDMAVGIAVEAAAALHHAHEQRDPGGKPLGIVHRDISPSNILVAHTGAVKVIDFGIARAIGVSRTTQAGVVKGKAGYMSPEQCRDETLDRRTDVFGLGIVLYEMTTGYRLFHASSDYAAMNKIAEGRFTPPGRAVEGYPEALEGIVMRCLAPDPDDRYPTGDALREDLEAFALEHRLPLSAAARATVLEQWLGPATDIAPSAPSAGDDLEDRPTRSVASQSRETVALTPAAPPLDETVTLTAAESSPRRRWMLVPLTAGLVGLVGLALWGLRGPSKTPATTAPPPPPMEDAIPVAAPALIPTPAVSPAPHSDPSPDDVVDAVPTPEVTPETTPETAPETTPRRNTRRSRTTRPRSESTETRPTSSSHGKKKTLLPPSMRE